jgi:hypothetical protein
MNQKDLKKLAKTVAKLEKMLATTTDEVEKANIESQIETLCAKVSSFEEVIILDELIQDYMTN